MEKIEQVIKGFDLITLEETNACAKLMNRVDTKFVGSSLDLSSILCDLAKDYKILEIEGKRVLPYKTIYFDTDGFMMYNFHQNGKLNRFKIRCREYVISGIHFLEIKFKNNKGRTIKKRIQRIDSDDFLSDEERLFVEENSPYKGVDLEKKIINNFSRITLVGIEERITIDFDLRFSNDTGNEVKYPEVMIVELKQSKFTYASPASRVLKQYGIRPEGFSKYCLGAASLNEHIKSNRMKTKFRMIEKIK